MRVSRYLADEVRSPARREYVGGHAYGMAGASNAHNQIATNLLIALGVRLRGCQCRPFHSDTKVRVRLGSETRFYYPDVSVTCRPNPPEDTWQDEPILVAEVLSPQTRRIDQGEKLLAYQSIPSLAVCVLLETDTPCLSVWRRTANGFVDEIHDRIGAVVALPELGIELPLAEIYAEMRG
ncbi:MAG: Uma2 family endonuclease [Planctomycetes bacterium]|jgi:Uma2 family endonuclease|nr:Uma2 family endonuclease [Planctomycetota bacterium]